MKACKNNQDKLLLYLKRELDKEESELMEIHLDECNGCREELHNLKRIDRFVIKNLSLEQAPVVLPAKKNKHVFRYLLAAAAVFILIWVILPTGQAPQTNPNGDPLLWNSVSGSDIRTLEYEYQRLVYNDSDVYTGDQSAEESGDISDYLYDLNTRIDYINESQL